MRAAVLIVKFDLHLTIERKTERLRINCFVTGFGFKTVRAFRSVEPKLHRQPFGDRAALTLSRQCEQPAGFVIKGASPEKIRERGRCEGNRDSQNGHDPNELNKSESAGNAECGISLRSRRCCQAA